MHGSRHAFRRAVERLDRELGRRVFVGDARERLREELGIGKVDLDHEALAILVEMQPFDGRQRRGVQQALRRLSRRLDVLAQHALGVARRLGLNPPVPLTFRFPGIAEAEEDAWQESMVRHLGLDNWMRHEIDDELDLLGPYARRVLLRHGTFWPPNAFALSIAAEGAK